jgi:hypothetical protein
MTTTIAQVRDANRVWFSPLNCKFLGDISYRVLHDRNKNPYLVRQTYGFSDMFTGIKVAHWKINPLSEHLEIKPMLDGFYDTLTEVKQVLKTI